MELGAGRKIDSLGRIVLPSEVRRQLCIEENDMLHVTIENGRIVLTPQRVDGLCPTCGQTVS